MRSATCGRPLLRALGLAFLAATGAGLFATQLPDRVNGAAYISPAGADPTHLREDLVFAVQAELALRGFNPGEVDGMPGARTTSAIKQFQTWAGIEPDGKISGELLQALQQRP